MTGLLAGLLLVTLVLASCNSGEDSATVPVLDDAPSETEDATSTKQSESASSSTTTGNQIDRTDLSMVFSQGQCQGKERVRLTAAPADPNDLAYIFPLGLMTGAHVTPVDHQYYYWDDMQAPLRRYPVRSPAEGYVVVVEYLENDYRVVIEHSCDVYSIFIHLEKLDGPLADINDMVSWGKPHYSRVPVKAGETIAFDGGTAGFDFSVHDNAVVLPGFVNPASYVAEPWKIHTVDPYDYFEEPVRSQLLTRNLRQVEPLGGKIDHDIRGRLAGNWFVEGTNGYQGITHTDTPIKPDQQIGYWNTHLAIAPDPIDPSTVIVSLGWFDGGSAQLAVREPDPLPAEVSVDTGLVRYELWDWQYVHDVDKQPWHGMNGGMATDIKVILGHQMRGTVLFKLLDEAHLKMEVFSGLGADEVSDFTENAVIYER